MVKIINFICVISIFLFSNVLFSTNVVSGIVKDTFGYPLVNIKVTLSEQGNVIESTLTNEKGFFSINTDKKGAFLIVFSGRYFTKHSKKINIINSIYLNVNLKFKEIINELNSINVTSIKKSTQLKKSSFNISSLDTKNLVKKGGNSSDLISEVSGVNIRTNGGLGSSTQFSINGIGGKQIGFFLDGIPTEFYGSNLNVGVFSSNFIERIDVYKGVIPIQLSADALGGAVNLISNNSKRKLLNINYNLGSFNTHRFSFNNFKKIRKNLYFNLNAFYNHSDNDYKMKNVEVIDKKGKVNKQTVPRFHNKYDNWFVKCKLGVQHQRWADEVFIDFYSTGTKYEIQNNRFGDEVYGGVYRTNLSFGTLVKYKKKNLFKNIAVDFYAVYKISNPSFFDVSRNLFNWKGEVLYTKKLPNIGEMSSLGINRHVCDTGLAGQLNLSWKPNDYLEIQTTYQKSHSFRKGKDIIAEKNKVEDLLKYPTKYDKDILGLSFSTRLLNNKFSSVSFLKKYVYRSSGYDREFKYYGVINSVLGKQKQFGYGQTFSFKKNESIVFKASYEYALRLPSPEEIYGNLGGIVPNINLKPEKSHNLNLGVYYKRKKISFDANLFFRRPKNLIFLKTSKFLNQYQNIAEIRILGVDSEISCDFFKNLNTKLNFSWQDATNQISTSKYKNDKLPNRPFLFGNLSFNYKKSNFLKDTNDLKVWYAIRYVKEFFLSWESEGQKNLKNIIPSQFPQQIGLSFIPKKSKYSISFECQNIFDQLTFDRFKLQKRGRSFYITLNYKK